MPASHPLVGPRIAERLARRLSRPITRFAPAPTGHLHLGHIVNAIYVWGLARALGGQVILRVEDHDRQRSRPEYERALLDDLDWLGFEPDVHPTADYRSGGAAGRQSARGETYRRRLDPLIDAGLVYGCRCSRAEIQAGTPGPMPPCTEDAMVPPSLKTRRYSQGEEMRYPGTCRDLGIALTDDVGWRLRIEPGEEAFDDGLLGWQVQNPAEQCGDVLLRDRRGNWTYQCAATLDDDAGQVSLVIRGLDLLASTGRQIRIARLVGRANPPVFVHHPLVMKSATAKLSKSNADTGICHLRARGWAAEEVIGRAARLGGLAADDRPIAAADVERLFR